jgi:hypothetical protein
MLLWNRKWTRNELLERIGAVSQLGGVTRVELCDGKAKGVTTLQVRTAEGFEFNVVPDKGMDIVEASYKGKSLCWHSPAGIVHPSYYDARDIQWVKTFAGGLLCSCGLTTAGFPSEDAGQQCGLHGPISNIPAEHVTWESRWKGDEYVLGITGQVREAHTHGPNLLLTRSFATSLDSRGFSLHDSVENQGVRESPLMQIYHMNFGFPLLTEHSRIYSPTQSVESRDAISEPSRASFAEFEPPTQGIEERVYYHDMKPNAQGDVMVVLVSDDSTKDFGVSIRYGAATLPRFIEWKMTGSNHFVLGLEPSNCKVGGRKAERDSGTLKILKPGEKQEFRLTFQVLDGKEEVLSAISSTHES